MTPIEIKQHFGIDITTKSRDNLFVYLRAIYTNENKGKLSNHIIACHIKKDRTSVIYLQKSYENYKKDPHFKLIYNCYKLKDKKLLEKSKEYLRVKHNEAVALINAKKIINNLKEPEVKEVEKFKKPLILEAAKNLRKIETPLKDKQFYKWTNEDLKQYYNLIR